MTKEELLRVYSAYLPYRLHVQSQQTGTIYQLNTFSDMRGQGVENRDIESVLNGNFKPLLWDLSYLTKEIEHDGEVFEPMDRMYKEWDCEAEVQFLSALSDDWASADEKLQFAPYSIMQKLLSWHFNVFNLPEDQFINKATLCSTSN